MPKPNSDSGHVAPASNSAQPAPFSGEKSKSVESVAKPRRRTFSAAEKLRMVREADRCLASGERGALEAMLRREGIYSSLLSTWRIKLGSHGATGLQAGKPGPKAKLTEAERRSVELEKRIKELEKKLHVANVLLGLQKKACEVLGLALDESGVNDHPKTLKFDQNSRTYG